MKKAKVNVAEVVTLGQLNNGNINLYLDLNDSGRGISLRIDSRATTQGAYVKLYKTVPQADGSYTRDATVDPWILTVAAAKDVNAPETPILALPQTNKGIFAIPNPNKPGRYLGFEAEVGDW